MDTLPSPITFAGTDFTLVENGNSSIHYIWLHGDEKTAKMALDHHISHFPGRAFFIQNDNREIPYLSTIIDPNRLFSRGGSYLSLTKFKPYWPPGTLKKALDDIERDRIQFLEIIMPKKDGILISVHNNFRGYNVKYELKYSRKTSIKKQQNHIISRQPKQSTHDSIYFLQPIYVYNTHFHVTYIRLYCTIYTLR